MLYQVNEGGKWFCEFCKDYSDDSYYRVHDHKMLTHCLPKEYFK